ncbi:MAG: bifunctional serine/threonine-protein kinase/formylglycine-generating enzyme family protein [Planctomycetota bacterium]|nr:bifunctional serine/threonine-protein kinase/formylglycine-generating enzyme family protein [Planctomycetota bacterium]
MATDKERRSIDKLCAAFGEELESGNSPDLLPFVEMAEASVRSEVMVHLIQLELNWRNDSSALPAREEYYSRFPDYHAQIDAAFERFHKKGPLPTDKANGTQSVSAENQVTQPGFGEADTGIVAPMPGTSSEPEDFRRHLGPARRPGSLGSLAHYEIDDVIGRGGFGVVVRAFDSKLQREVAIKLMTSQSGVDPGCQERFVREARAAAAIAHENVVTIHAVEDNPCPYLVMELVKGCTLQQFLEREKSLSVIEAVRIARQVAAGLAAAHGVNLIHRDIKPSNILLQNGSSRRVKISDFGLARSMDDEGLTRSGLIVGTPLYMAPEQARGAEVDSRVDLFSLGSLMYRMIAARAPFQADHPVAVLKRVCEDTPRSLEDSLAESQRWLESVIFSLLAKDPEQRLQPTAEVERLLDYCEGELERSGTVTGLKQHFDTTNLKLSPRESPRRQSRNVGILAVGFILVLILSFAVWGPLSTRGEGPVPALAVAPFEDASGQQDAWAESLGVEVDYTNSIGMRFRLIPAGQYLMGGTAPEIEEALEAASKDPAWQKDIRSEGPQKKVTVERPFFIGVHEVTRGQYDRVMGGLVDSESAKAEDSNYPVVDITWQDASDFCQRLSELEFANRPVGNEGKKSFSPPAAYRLPTEPEWEFACRAGTTSRFWFGDRPEEMMEYGWCKPGASEHLHEVGQLKPNPFGLFDVHGNACEWTGFEVGEGGDRIARGGDWSRSPIDSRSSTRISYSENERNGNVGFRVVLPAPPGKAGSSDLAGKVSPEGEMGGR